MSGKNTVVFGIYRDTTVLGGALEELRVAGFRSTEVSVLIPEHSRARNFVHKKDTKAPEAATTSTASGAGIGGALGWLAGLGALAIPGLGSFIAAGPIMGMIEGAGAGGVTGGIAGSLVGVGIPEYEAKRYGGRIKSGGILLLVHCDNSDWVKRAKSILEQTGGQDVSSAGDASADYATSDRPASRF